MTLNLELSPDLAEKLNAEVDRRGIPAEDVVRLVLDGKIVMSPGPRSWTGNTTSGEPTEEERDAAFEDFLRLSDEFPGAGIPAEMLRREHLYDFEPTVSGPMSASMSRSDDWKQKLTAVQRECEELLRDAPIIPLEALRRENLYADDGL